ncbi:ankyrin repeat, SAM and basic leucine zipper domain containing 1 L homeolog [Xenopus laevis]|uniref:Ankyrin repeat, SAM and basic leucine zipper domain-containing protein 1 n=1 Tax=Xenopus laevis TaxID=8355 RepID=Q6JXL5_XENLA|nr:ankyrin repeat, SAM and basic leucine zipper domain containing 1 L homeolog [Xenopus laevis]AAQ21088.1 GASZ [Xenopus laevis]
MALSRYQVVPGGGESSGSDDGWDMGEVREPDEKIDKNPVNESNEDIFKKALTTGNVKIVEQLLKSGLNVECCFQFGWTPLMYAASVANMEMIRLLLDRGANASFEKDKFTVLMAACTAHSSEEKIVKCVDLLLSRNADPNIACRKQMTPLMYSAREGHPQVVSLLVAHGANIHAQDENGYTGLAWAAHDGRKNIVLKMLELGADKTLSTKNGETPAEIARKFNHLEIFSILSFSANMGQGKVTLNREEAIYRYLKIQPDQELKHTSYSTSSDLEVFLGGLDLEHLTELFKENDITLRQLLHFKGEELKKVGISCEVDCKKIVVAVKEIQVEDARLEEFSTFLNLESSSDELFAFLLKLNRQCNCLTQTVRAVNDQIPLNPQNIVLEWDYTQNFTSVCEDIVTSVADLNKEVYSLQCLLTKFKKGQQNTPCRVPPLEDQNGWRKYGLLKMSAAMFLSFGFIFLLVKVNRDCSL